VAVLDWVVLAVLALSVLSWLAAFLLAQWLAPQAGAWLPLGQWSEAIRYAAGFVVVFIAALFAGGLLAWLTKKLVEAAGLKPVDRVLGALFGLVRGTVAVLALAVVVHLTGLKNGAWWTESMTAGVATAALRGLKPVVPERFGSYLPA